MFNFQKAFKKAAVFIIIFFSSLLLAGLVSAQNIKSGESTVLPSGETVNNDYFASGGMAIVSGTVNGDTYLMGGNITVDGEINGDLLIIGGNADIRGRVTGDIRVVGGQVTVAGEVGRNLSAVGGSVSVTDRARIRGNLVAASGSLDVFGPVDRDVIISGGQATLGSGIGGNVNSTVGRLVLTSGARVSGNLNYTSGTPAQIQSGAVVSGTVTQQTPPGRPTPGILGALAAASIAFKIISFISYLIVGLLLLRFFPNFTREKAATLFKRPLISLLIGFIALILIPVVIFLLMFTVIGIPIALIALAIYLIALYLSIIVTSLALGWKAFDLIGQKRTGGWALLLGLVIYEILTIVPILGGFVTFFALLFGLGALLLAWKNYYQRLQSKDLV